MVEKLEATNAPSPQPPTEDTPELHSAGPSTREAWILGFIPRRRIRLTSIYENSEDRRVARILLRISAGFLAMLLVVAVVSIFGKDPKTALITLVGAVLLILPLWLLFKGHLQTAAFIVIFTGLAIITTSATAGQGIHDIGLAGFPLVVVCASLLLRRRGYFVISALTLGAIAWLVFGDVLGLFTANPYDLPGVLDFVVVAAIMILAIVATDTLAQNMRKSLNLARREIDQRKEMESKLRQESIHDALTGIHNRAYFEEELARLDQGQDFPVSIIISDLDDMKTVNDEQGHAIGDDLLQHTASVLKNVFRTSDILARIGGDEFAVLLPRTDAATVAKVVVRAQARIMEHNRQNPELPIKLSLGAFTAEKGKLEDAFIAADRRMYAEKAKGKSSRE
jgi:diguanylate cyclase (GGDEF)-like protein